MFESKADSTPLVVHRPDLLEQPVPLMAVQSFVISLVDDYVR
jgi:hypothetical protein